MPMLRESTFAAFSLGAMALPISDPRDPVAMATGAPRAQDAAEEVTAFVGVTLIPMDRPGALPGRTVIVRGGRIEAVGDGAIGTPAGARLVDGAGRFLIPGLIDDHVHLFDSRDLLLYLVNGVTTVRNLKGMPFHLDLRARIAAGELLGPRLLTAGPYLNEPQFTTPDDYDDAAREQAEAGYDCLKIHGDVSEDALIRLADVSEELELPLVGHVPRNQLLEDVLRVGGMREISHAEELLYTHFEKVGKPRDPREIPRVVELMAGAGVHLTPTFVAYSRIADQAEDLDAVLARPELRFLPPLERRLYERDLNDYPKRFDADDVQPLRNALAFQKRFVKALHEGGVPILLGTDAGIAVVPPGFTAHDELANLVDAGLPAFDALAAATVRNDEFLAVEPPLGRIAPGCAADLVLLDADPLADIGNTRRIAGVMARGRWLPREELDRLLAEQVAGYGHEAELARRIDVGSATALLDAVRELPRGPGDRAPLDERFLEALGLLYLSIGKPALAAEVFGANLDLFPGTTSARKRLDETRASTAR